MKSASDKAVNSLKCEQSAAAFYLLSIDLSMYITVFVPGRPVRLYGQHTSNPVEVMNFVSYKVRRLSVIGPIPGISHYDGNTLCVIREHTKHSR